MEQNSNNIVDIRYQQTGESSATNELGMREMQAKAYEACSCSIVESRFANSTPFSSWVYPLLKSLPHETPNTNAIAIKTITPVNTFFITTKPLSHISNINFPHKSRFEKTFNSINDFIQKAFISFFTFFYLPSIFFSIFFLSS